MIKLTTYINDNSFLTFNFNDCAVDYRNEVHWVNVFAAKQKLTIQNSFIAADETIGQTSLAANPLAQSWIQDLYKQGNKILIISSKDDAPICIYWGKDITLKLIQDDFCAFLIDGKALWTFGMKFLILTKNEAPV